MVDGQNQFVVVDVQSAAHYVIIRKVTQDSEGLPNTIVVLKSTVGEECMRQTGIQLNRFGHQGEFPFRWSLIVNL